MLNRRTFLKASTLATAGVLASCSGKSPNKPNILFIFADQQTCRAMSCCYRAIGASLNGAPICGITIA